MALGVGDCSRTSLIAVAVVVVVVVVVVVYLVGNDVGYDGASMAVGS